MASKNNFQCLWYPNVSWTEEVTQAWGMLKFILKLIINPFIDQLYWVWSVCWWCYSAWLQSCSPGCFVWTKCCNRFAIFLKNIYLMIHNFILYSVELWLRNSSSHWNPWAKIEAKQQPSCSFEHDVVSIWLALVTFGRIHIFNQGTNRPVLVLY